MRSLLWPTGRPGASQLCRLGEEVIRDLEILFLAERITADRPERRHVALDVLTNLPLDPAVTRWRAGVVSDLLDSPTLSDGLQGAARALRLLAAHRPQNFPRDVPRAARIGARVVELQAYVDAVGLLAKALETPAVLRPALAALRADLRGVEDTTEFRALSTELPRWRSALDEIRSVTITVNVSPAMEPESAVIVGFSSKSAEAGEAALSRLLGPEVGARGLSRLFRRQPVDWQAGDSRLVSDLQALLEGVAAPVERALHAYRLLNAQAVAHLEDELLVLLGAARLARSWRSVGLPCCVAEVLPALAEWETIAGAPRSECASPSSTVPGRPSTPGLTGAGARSRQPTDGPVSPPSASGNAPGPAASLGADCDARAGLAADVHVIRDAFLPALVSQMPRPYDIVTNGLEFGASGGIWILTGPNRGGKTTFLRIVGVVQVLGQCGLPVPARSTRLRGTDGIFTHFPELEAGHAGQGRLDEEAARLAHIFDTCSPRGLVLLNEVLAGTSAPEGVALATDVLRGFRVLGCRVVYATHLHELAMRCAELNASVAGSAVIASLVAESESEEEAGALVRKPTYRIVRGAPEGASFFASTIARHHGISLPQILERLHARSVADGR